MMVIQKRLVCQGNNVIKQKTKTQLVFSISQREIKELYCPVSADESQIKEVSIDLFEHKKCLSSSTVLSVHCVQIPLYLPVSMANL